MGKTGSEGLGLANLNSLSGAQRLSVVVGYPTLGYQGWWIVAQSMRKPDERSCGVWGVGVWFPF